MTASEFVDEYVLHDSLINDVKVVDKEKTIVIQIDLAFWMQNWYKESQPETGIIKVVFSDVTEYFIPEGVDWSEVSILGARVENGFLRLDLLNDMTEEYLEIAIRSKSVDVLDDTISE